MYHKVIKHIYILSDFISILIIIRQTYPIDKNIDEEDDFHVKEEKHVKIIHFSERVPQEVSEKSLGSGGRLRGSRLSFPISQPGSVFGARATGTL